MAVIVRSSDTVRNDDLWNEWSDQLDAVILDTDAQKNKYEDYLHAVANVKKSNKFAEKATTLGTLGDFDVKAEGADATEDTFQEGYDSLFKHYAFSKTVSLSRELVEDGRVEVMKNKTASMVLAYKRTKAKYISQILTTSVGATKTMTFGTQTGINIGTPDNLALFNAKHTLAAKSGTTVSNLFKDSFDATGATLNKIAVAMRNFPDDRGFGEGIIADTIIIPNNTPALEDLVKKVIGSDGETGGNKNDINTQRGRWKLIVDPFWTVTTTDGGLTSPYIIMSSEANKDLLGTMFYNRVDLDVKSEVKTESRNLVYNGFCRWSAGMNNWRHLAMGGSADSTATSV